MKKQILNIGKALTRVEQKMVLGGTPLQHEGGSGWCSDVCNVDGKVCPSGQECFKGPCDGDEKWMCKES